MRTMFSVLLAAASFGQTLQAQEFDDSNAYIAERAHSSRGSSTVLGLYNITMPGAEVDALATPTSGGFEYWPYVYDEQTGTHPRPYPDMIQWGYAAGGEQARKCMKLSHHIYKYVMANKPANLAALFSIQGAPTSYYNWNNDYTQAHSEDLGYREFWHYNRPSGLLKWISHTKMDGSCQHPTVEAIDLWAACEIKQLRNERDQCAGHR